MALFAAPWPAWWQLARTLEQRVDGLIDSLDGKSPDEQLLLLERLLKALDGQREVLKCGIDAIRRQAGAPPDSANPPRSRNWTH